MNINRVYVAMADDDRVTPTVIIINGGVIGPQIGIRYEETYAADAVKIADALERTLPGGTYKRLLAEMMRRDAESVLLRVAIK